MYCESEVAQSCLTLCDPMACSLPGFSVHGTSRQEYWSGLPLPSPAHTLVLTYLDIYTRFFLVMNIAKESEVAFGVFPLDTT